MRKLYFLVPGTGGKFACGGLWAELKIANLAKQVCSTEVVTYRQRESDVLFLDDLLQGTSLDDGIFVLSWGFDVPKLAKRLQRYPLIYHAHSAGYRFQLPSNVPIIAVSRNTMGYWGQRSPHSLIYHLPNQISNDYQNRHLERDIDVLVQARKSSHYLLQQLIPALKQKCNVYVIDSYVEDLAEFYNRTKIYLYDSAEYWAMQGVSEGFGLQPLEAMACGCRVFSSINGGLSDYLDPGFNSQKIAGYDLEYDLQRILSTLKTPPLSLPSYFFDQYRAKNITIRLEIILNQINPFFDHLQQRLTPIPPLSYPYLTGLKAQRLWHKVIQRFKFFN